MIRKTYRRRRLTIAIALAAALAAWGAPSGAAFDGRSPDTQEAAELVKGHGLGDARSPDTRDASHQATSAFLIDGRSPDTRDALERPSVTIVLVDRSPDSSDAATRVASGRTPAWVDFSARPTGETRETAPASGNHFYWEAFGVGVGVTACFLLLLAGLAAGSLRARDTHGARTGRVAT